MAQKQQQPQLRFATRIDVPGKQPQERVPFAGDPTMPPAQRALIEQLVLGSATTPPPGTTIPGKLKNDPAALNDAITYAMAAGRGLLPAQRGVWNDVVREHPYVAAGVKDIRVRDFNFNHLGSMRRGNISIADHVRDPRVMKDVMLHELAHVAQSMNYPTDDDFDNADPPNSTYATNPFENQSRSIERGAARIPYSDDAIQRRVSDWIKSLAGRNLPPQILQFLGVDPNGVAPKVDPDEDR